METVIDGKHRVEAMTYEEHRDVFQTISESIIAEQEAPVTDQTGQINPLALRGALYLDEHHPGWAKKIELKVFNIQDVKNCVVGQVAGYYDDYVRELFPVGDGYNEKAEQFGIMPNNNAADLNRSWKILIAERQGREVVNS